MTTATEADTYRRSIAFQFGHPMTSTTTMATLAYVALLTVGIVAAVAATMSVSELSAGTATLVATSAVVLGTTLAVLRRRLGDAS